MKERGGKPPLSFVFKIMSLQGKIFITEKRGKIPASCLSPIDLKKDLITYTQDLSGAVLAEAARAASAEAHEVRVESVFL